MATFESTEWVRNRFRTISWRRAIFAKVKFVEADLRQTDLHRASLRGVVFDRVKLPGSNLEEADLKDSTLTDVDLTDARLTGARFDGASLDRVDMSGSILTGACFESAELKKIRLDDIDESDLASCQGLYSREDADFLSSREPGFQHRSMSTAAQSSEFREIWLEHSTRRPSPGELASLLHELDDCLFVIREILVDSTDVPLGIELQEIVYGDQTLIKLVPSLDAHARGEDTLRVIAGILDAVLHAQADDPPTAILGYADEYLAGLSSRSRRNLVRTVRPLLEHLSLPVAG